MRFFVIDASVAIKWYIREQDSERAQSLLQTDVLFLVPDLFYVEVAGGLIRQHRLYEQISRDDLLLAIDDLSGVGIQAVSSATLLQRSVEISLSLGHPIKDCFYIALAERWETSFITADIKLKEKADRSEWAGSLMLMANAGQIV